MTKRLYFPATLLVFLVVLWAKAVYPPASGIADPDFYWHLTTGRWIIDHGALPSIDQFSWSMPGESYTITQWLGEYAMALLFNAGGLHATKAASVFLAGATIWLGWRAAMFFINNSMMALTLSILCNVVNLVTPLRPQIASFACMALLAYLVAGWSKTHNWRYLAPIPLVMALWANLHGGYVVGGIFLALFCAGQLAEALHHKALFAARRPLILLFGIAAIAVMATLANPYGLGAWKSVLLVSGLQSSSVIEEWKPVQITTEMGWFLLFIVMPFLLALLANRRPPITQVLLGAVFLFFAASANRQVAFAGAIMPFIAASMLAGTPSFEKIQATVTNPSRPVLFAVLVAGMLAAFPFIQAKGDYSWETTLDGQFPVSAHAFLKKNDLTERVLADIPESNFLMFHGMKVFIDSRMDYYKDKFFFTYLLASRGAPGWESFLATYRPNALLLRHDVALRQLALTSGQWKLVYQDDRYAVLVPAGEAYARIPAVDLNELTYLDQQGRLVRRYRP